MAAACRPANRYAGFLLIEVLITLTIAAVALAALVKFQVELYRAGAVAEQRADALSIAGWTIEELQARIRAGTPPAAGGSAVIDAAPDGTALSSGIDYHCQWLLIPSGGTVRIEVVVGWIDEHTGAQSIALNSSAIPAAALASGALLRKPPFIDPP